MSGHHHTQQIVHVAGERAHSTTSGPGLHAGAKQVHRIALFVAALFPAASSVVGGQAQAHAGLQQRGVAVDHADSSSRLTRRKTALADRLTVRRFWS